MASYANRRSWGNSSHRGGFYSSTKRDPTKQLCVHFQRGRCHYGDRCKFSHDAAKAAHPRPGQIANRATTAHDQASRDQYFDWKRYLRRGISRQDKSHEKCGEILRFWNEALEILQSDNKDNHQFLIKDLVDDSLHGYDFVLATTDAGKADLESPSATSYDEPFLKFVTHPALLNCLSVDTFVGTLYAFLGGTNGDRAIQYLRGVCKSWNDNRNKRCISLEQVKLLLSTLHEVLSRIQRARFHDELTALLESIQELMHSITETSSQADMDGLESKLRVMRSLITSANGNLSTPAAPNETTQHNEAVLSTFPLDLQTPGGRHDNDFAEISRIGIFPTCGEIISGHSEYLPSTNFLQPHILPDPLQRYIDSTFRLLRHDVFGSSKDILRDLLLQDDLTQASKISSKDNAAHIYLEARVPQIFINERKELEATVSFSAPPQVRRKTSGEQCKWWQDSNRLEEGSLVCFLTSQSLQRRLIFLEVTQKNTSRNEVQQNKSSLVSDKHPPSVSVKLAVCQQQELIFLAQLYRQRISGILVDFHGLIPATFAPILRNLQRIQREGDLAFQKWILPGLADDGESHRIPPPAYARKMGFRFPLTAIAKSKTENLVLDPNYPASIDTSNLQHQTGLDLGQCHGLIAALTREYALVQGPPGTGKSYLGVKLVQVLLGIKRNADLGPILVICYTNHALDQFLKHLLDVGIQKIIRIGGRSQATELEGKNLRVVSKAIDKTRVESQSLGKSFGELEECMKSAEHAMKPLHQSKKGLSWATLEHFVQERWPKIHRQLQETDADGFTIVTGDKLLDWLGKKSFRIYDSDDKIEDDDPRLEALTQAANANIHILSVRDRQILATSWFKMWQNHRTDLLFEAIDHAASIRNNINAVHDEINRRALIQADVIGITTTALARNIETLRRLGTKVVVCEEAAEVMEAHVISALMPGVEHFIQIGDHRQLRPQIQNHSLSLETSTGRTWQLDRSQFERRAVGEPGLDPAPVAQLNVQRRMRPEISQLIRTVYPRLQDHESVTNLPNVIGMRHNLFWLDHRYPEDSRDDGSRVKSRSNQWEVEMTTALVRHLVRQGEYKSTDIALLTPYTGQLRKLRASLSSDFEICLSERDLETLASDGLDDFEDEKSKPNARQSLEKKTLLQTLRLATVDNFQGEEAKVIVVSLVRSNPKRKVGFLRTENRINVLLSRAQHGMYLIGNAETYLNVPMWADVHSRLACANAVGTELALCCPRHPDSPIFCSEPSDFERKSPEGGCILPCTRRLEPCGHQCQAKCHSTVMHDGFACGKPCQRIRSTCDHECPKLCGESCGPCMVKIENVELPCGHIKKTVFCHRMSHLKDIKCDFEVEKLVPKCGHTVQVGCYRDVTSPIFRCPTPCDAILSCGHNCVGTCGECLDEVIDGERKYAHTDCKKICDRLYGGCNHRCPKVCHSGKSCGHCEAKCECGNKGDVRVDLVELKTYSEIDLDESPIIVLGCGHFFTSESVDGMVGLDEVYTRDKTGKFNGLRNASSSLADNVPSCPDCKQPIRQFVTKRYNRVINRAVMDETCKRFLIDGRTRLGGLESVLDRIEDELKSDPANFLTGDTRHKQCANLAGMALVLGRNTAIENQPSKRLMDAIITCQKSSESDIATLLTKMKTLNIAPRDSDNQISLGARLLHFKAKEVIRSDIIRLMDSNKKSLHPPRIESNLTLSSWTRLSKGCRDLITQANDGHFFRISIEATIIYAKIIQLEAWYRRNGSKQGTSDSEPNQEPEPEKIEDRLQSTRDLLAAALERCNTIGNCLDLQVKLQEIVRLFEGPRYETVTPEELQAIKTAMVSGRGGIATHSGHWYNCANGHPFAIGECGMPMEQARCPECGAPIGGQNHTAVAGVTRAREME
ncbi:hypothetical protein POX_h09681 [Penicillium oxalicum]|uniref:hypothetical protein n=1 Tax=Penicillium oxalicum TaxID=69781 RepID=UPI0020B76B0F|nr:hypothetical protein POX_h09681 [Penicillium oxalicum]KAI2785918.1 hypothetical protein POX_h09681 [Penicillium oxalicum]